MSHSQKPFSSVFISCTCVCVCQDSSVSTATCYALDDTVIESLWQEIFRTLLDQPWVPPSLLYIGYRLSSLGVKRPGRGVDHPPLSSDEVKERVEIFILRFWAFMAGCRVKVSLRVRACVRSYVQTGTQVVGSPRPTHCVCCPVTVASFCICNPLHALPRQLTQFIPVRALHLLCCENGGGGHLIVVLH